jgi:hypothetical protein
MKELNDKLFRRTTDAVSMKNTYIRQMLDKLPFLEMTEVMDPFGNNVNLWMGSIEEAVSLHLSSGRIGIHTTYPDESVDSIRTLHESPAVAGKAVPMQYVKVVAYHHDTWLDDERWMEFDTETALKISNEKLKYDRKEMTSSSEVYEFAEEQLVSFFELLYVYSFFYHIYLTFCFPLLCGIGSSW